jgi:hypothetical protein
VSSVSRTAVGVQDGVGGGRLAKQLLSYGKLQRCFVRWRASFPLQDVGHTSFIVQTDERRGSLLTNKERLDQKGVILRK